MVSEAKAVAALVCDASLSGFDSRQTPSEDAAKWLATGLENQGRVVPRGSSPPSSFYPLEAEIATRTADNCVVGGAVPP
jgi:hypothetical protein